MSLALALLASALSAADAHAASSLKEPASGIDPLLLTHPASAFLTKTAARANFFVRVDQQALSYEAPEIVFQKSGADADFIVGVWRDAQGNIVHQREVLIVKPDYGVVVDYLYGWKGAHEVSCVVKLPASEVKMDKGASQVDCGNGQGFTVQHLGAGLPLANPAIPSSPGSSAVSETYKLTLPAPFSSFFSKTQSVPPKMEFVQASNPMVVKCKVTLPDGRIDEVGIAWEARDQLHLGCKVLKGWAAVARKGPCASADIEIKAPLAVPPTTGPQ